MDLKTWGPRASLTAVRARRPVAHDSRDDPLAQGQRTHGVEFGLSRIHRLAFFRLFIGLLAHVSMILRPGAPHFRFVLGQKETPIGSAYRLQPAYAPMGGLSFVERPRTGMRNRRILSVGLPLPTSTLMDTTPNRNLRSRFIWISLRQPRGSARALIKLGYALFMPIDIEIHELEQAFAALRLQMNALSHQLRAVESRVEQTSKQLVEIEIELRATRASDPLRHGI